MNETFTFQARIYIVRDGERDFIDSMKVWCNELEPMDGKKCSVEEWVTGHIQGCMSADDIREILELPAEGDFQVVFSGSIHGETDYWGEYDEELSIDKTAKFKAIPPGWLKPHVCEHGIALNSECHQCNED